MKKICVLFLALLLSVFASVSVSADVNNSDQVPAYSTSYYVIVESPDGGIDLYPSPNASDTKLNDELIPNGSVLHVDGEKTDDNGRLYGYVDYHGMRGYISLDYANMITAAQALQAEMNDSTSTSVNYDAEANGRAGSVAMYHGPSDQFDLVTGSTAIPNGEILHVTAEAENAAGENWVQATHNDVEGWLPQEQILVKEDKALLDATPIPISTPKPTATPRSTSTPTPKPTSTATPTPKPTSTPTPKPTSTPTPVPTSTSTPTPVPTSTNTPTPEPTNTDTPTPEPTNTSTPVPEPTNTDTPAPDSTETSDSDETLAETSGTPDEAVTEAPGESSGDDFQPTDDTEKSVPASTDASESTSHTVSPLLIVLAAALILILILLLIALRKKDKTE